MGWSDGQKATIPYGLQYTQMTTTATIFSDSRSTATAASLYGRYELTHSGSIVELGEFVPYSLIQATMGFRADERCFSAITIEQSIE